VDRARRFRLKKVIRIFDADSPRMGVKLARRITSLIDAENAALPALEWKSSATRRKANRLIHDSVALMNGGYKRLLRGG